MLQESTDPKLPECEGVEGVDGAGGEGRPRKKFDCPPGCLADAAADWVYFHHGVMYTIGGLDRDVIAMAYEQAGLGGDEAVGVLGLGCELLRGLDGGRYKPGEYHEIACELFAVSAEHWPMVRDALRTVSAIDRKRRVFWRATTCVATILDPTWQYSARTAAARPIDVHLFGVDATFGRFGFEVTEPWGYPIRIRRSPPCGETIALANMLLDDSHRPFRAVEPTEHHPDVIAAARSLVLPPGVRD